MRIKQKKKYLPFDQFVVRTPLLSLSQFFDKLKRLDEGEMHFTSLLSDKSMLEAIYLGSPVLYSEIEKYINGGVFSEKEEDRLKQSVVRYFSRMSTRCTPFGLFSACSLGSIGDQTSVVFPEVESYQRHTRLDMNYLCALAQDIAQKEEMRSHLRYFPNTSIYEYGPQLRYVEYKYKNTRRVHSIVSVDKSSYILAVLDKAKSGAFINEMADVLIDEEIDKETATDFIYDLIANQVLVDELEPAITGEEFFHQLEKVMLRIPGVESLKEILKNVNQLLEQIDSCALGNSLSVYAKIIELLERLKTTFDSKYLFQSDMIKPVLKSGFSMSDLNEIMQGVELLNKMTLKGSGESRLTRFRDAFYERYEDRSVPLLKVLDTESGIGYDMGNYGDVNPLIDDIYTPLKIDDTAKIRWNTIYSILNNKLVNALSSGESKIEITDDDFKDREAEWDDLPLTMSVMCEVFSYSQDKKRFYLKMVGDTSAVNLLGRFCHADEQIYKYTKNIAEKEANIDPDVIFAEIVHLPEARTGNILLRPVLRSYEIPYLAKSGVDPDFQLALSDLNVMVQDGKIVLYSERLGKRVIPKMGTAHNYSYGAMPVYQFLCDLQSQEIRSNLSFNWGELSGEYDFLPEVRYKNLILSEAQWKVRKTEVAPFLSVEKKDELLKKVAEWQIVRKLPRRVKYLDGDNELFVDLNNELSIRAFFGVVKKHDTFYLSAFSYSSEINAVSNVQGDNFSNEFVFAIYKSLGE